MLVLYNHKMSFTGNRVVLFERYVSQRASGPRTDGNNL